MSDTHWTQYDKPDLKKYIFKLHGEIERLKKRLKDRPLKELPKTTDTEKKLMYQNATLRRRLKLYEDANRLSELTELKSIVDDDLHFVSLLSRVPDNKIIRDSDSRNRRFVKVVHARRLYSYIKLKKGYTLSDIARDLGYRDHSTIIHLMKKANLITEAEHEEIDNYLNRNK